MKDRSSKKCVSAHTDTDMLSPYRKKHSRLLGSCKRTAMIAECDSGFHRIKGVFDVHFVHVCVLCVSGALGCCLFICLILIRLCDKHDCVCVCEMHF